MLFIVSKPASMGNDGFEEIPAHLLDEINGAGGTGSGSASANDAPGAGAGATQSGPTACPHCTYENEPGAQDCDVCGLPLA